ncbi:MAG: c-type cytochrome [Chloroflexaceae bacterium]
MHRRTHLAIWIALLLSLAACGAQPATDAPATGAFPADRPYSARGDAERGARLFSACASCHATTTEQVVGPGLAGLFDPAGPALPPDVDYGGKLPNGKERTEATIAAWIREGGIGRIGFMPPQRLNDQELADLIAYLRTLSP